MAEDGWGLTERATRAGMVCECLYCGQHAGNATLNTSNACKHSGAVLPPPSALVGRGADGDVAMA
jgi:hypothetical protein